MSRFSTPSNLDLQFSHPKLARLGSSARVTSKTMSSRRGVANVAARWVMDKPGVAAILVGARDASHVLDNLRTFDVRLDAEDVALIERILEPMEGPRGDCGQLERKRGN